MQEPALELSGDLGQAGRWGQLRRQRKEQGKEVETAGRNQGEFNTAGTKGLLWMGLHGTWR